MRMSRCVENTGAYGILEHVEMWVCGRERKSIADREMFRLAEFGRGKGFGMREDFGGQVIPCGKGAWMLGNWELQGGALD